MTEIARIVCIFAQARPRWKRYWSKVERVELSQLPQVGRIVKAPELAELEASLGKKALTAIAREIVASARAGLREGEPVPTFRDIVDRVAERARERMRTQVTRVINATGVLLHTNLGRAPLPVESLDRIREVAGRYSTLELDAELGTRTRRALAVEAQLAELVGAEDALLVNNNAAAVFFALAGLAHQKNVIVSRGELVEIGGGFRIPEVLAHSGARLVEVGTTNRTTVDDYARAIDKSTGCLLRVHPSNFKITGFSHRPTLSSLGRLARERGIPLVKDLGGGLVTDLGDNVKGDEPTVNACLAAGAGLVCFSLDKLFGGPQGGAIVGDRELVARLRSDPLARALRIDKLVILALEPVLNAYLTKTPERIPLHVLLHTSVTELKLRVEAWYARVSRVGQGARVVETQAAIGGGTLAEEPVASVGLAVSVPDPDALVRALGRAEPPVIARIVEGEVVFDARSVFPDEDAILVATLCRILEDLLRP
jgi:L-seryl-tRNA(Ser) seleniumtransferase